MIAVRDSGIGIEPEMQPKVFDVFTQATSDAWIGRTAALAWAWPSCEVWSLCTAARWPCSARGAAGVRLSLSPASCPDAAYDASVEETVPAVKARSRVCVAILIVDDNRDSAEMLRSVVGARLRDQVAFDAAGALEAVEGVSRDVALLDIGLPVMSGYELARAAAGESASAPISLIAVTGYGQPRDREASAEAGFDAHLVKPIDLEPAGADRSDPQGAAAAPDVDVSPGKGAA